MTSCCSICFDDEEDVLFECSKRTCTYKMCGPCIRDAFRDSSGSNSSYCQFCKTPSALDMISAVCGTGAIKAVERDVRSSIEFELKAELLKRDTAKIDLSEINAKATKIFNQITDDINLHCPRCKMVFHDYDGCNALTCASPECRAAFCAICLKDCGNDAHSHVLSHHGDYFDKKAFEVSKMNRVKNVISKVMNEITDEPFELKQLVKNHIDKAKLVNQSQRGNDYRSLHFFEDAKDSLLRATQNDRLALLSDPGSYRPERYELNQDDISPRCSFPDEFNVVMQGQGGNIYDIYIEFYGDDFQKRVISPQNIERECKDVPHIDILKNLVQNLKCSVLVFSGHSHMYQTRHAKIPEKTQLRDNQICVSVYKVSEQGKILEQCNHLSYSKLLVLGFNPNLRFLTLEKHVDICEDSQILFPALKNLVGDGKISPVLTEILRPTPESQSELNEIQKKVAHPLCLKTAMEVAGPPGTGKTKTIVELVRALLECTDFDIIVLSERNGAINAIAEKFKQTSLKIEGDNKKINVSNPLVWLSVMTYGSDQTMGESTKLFSLEKKISYHPDVVRLLEKVKLLKDVSTSLAKEMRRAIASSIQKYGNSNNIDVYRKCDSIEFDKENLNSPLVNSRYLNETVEALEKLLGEEQQGIGAFIFGSYKNFNESDVDRVINDHHTILDGIIEVRTHRERERNPSGWDSKRIAKVLQNLHKILKETLQHDYFDEDQALKMYDELAAVKEACKTLQTRLKEELQNNARLHMSTIGSSHKLPVKEEPKESDILEEFGSLSLDDNSEKKRTIVIFDEAGCIPSYELLGLSRLGREFEAILLVGDEHQLPPYNPSQGGNLNRRNSRGGRGTYGNMSNKRIEPLKSLLDVSTLSIDDGKLMLTEQYRVPRDIADILNARVYKGSYNTCPDADVPLLGLKVCHVDEDRNPRKKYVNSNEIEYGFELLDELNRNNEISDILIITPYKNQQREFEFQFKKRQMDVRKYPVLTIDQCQGQEADAVILSLVRKPTKFLNLNRLNVALSRVRKRLYVLVDKTQLRQACRNSDWEAALLAGDLLNLY